jgi:hypothetical protein
MAAKKIAVLYRSSLLAQGLEAALRRAEDTEVHGLDLDTPGVLEQVAALAPFAVVVDPQELPGDSFAGLLDLLQRSPLVCVVSLRRGEDVVDILRKERVEVTKARDVLAAVVGPRDRRIGPSE